MPYSNISVSLSQDAYNNILKSIDDISNAMPFLVTLSNDEKQTLFKLGSKSADFVSDALFAAKNFPEIIPPAFDAVEFEKDSVLFLQLVSIVQKLDSLAEKTNDTLIAVGSEAMQESLQVYSLAQASADTRPGLKSVIEKLGERFKKNGSKAKPAQNDKAS